MKDLTIVIPTLNEEKNITILIKEIFKINKEIKIIVVDDGSTDNTKNNVQKFSNVLFIDRNNRKIKGLTASILEGLKKAKTKYIIVMDGDLQHPPKNIPKIYTSLKKGNDLVIASRKRKYIRWEKKQRKIFSDLATFLSNFILTIKNSYSVIDPMSGFFGINKNLIQKLNKKKFVLEGYKVLFDILKQCKKEKIDEIIFEFNFRNNGKSKMNITHSFYLLKSFFK